MKIVLFHRIFSNPARLIKSVGREENNPVFLSLIGGEEETKSNQYVMTGRYSSTRGRNKKKERASKRNSFQLQEETVRSKTRGL